MAALLALTLASAVRQAPPRDLLAAEDLPRPIEAEAPSTTRCSIFQARFGGTRARLVKVMRGSVPNYIVVEVGRRDPLLQRQRSIWLRGAFGDGEQTWLGEFASPEAAMRQATTLCPPHLRCGPGEADCGPQGEPPTPVKAFMQL
jgi:hypothetical protein